MWWCMSSVRAVWPIALQQHAQPQEVHRLVVQHRAAHQAEAELRRPPHVAVELVAVVRRTTPPPPRPRTTGRARWSPPRSRARAPRGSNAPPRARRGPSRGSTPGSPSPRSCSAGRSRRCRRRRAPKCAANSGYCARDDHQRPPAVQRRQLGVERQRARDLQQARGALGALEVAPEPEAVIGDARDHDAASACTQVSFEPPPWLELTTYEPSSSATRVRPPGQHPARRPCRSGRTAAGRRAAAPGAARRRSQVGQVDSSMRCCAMYLRGSATMRARNSSQLGGASPAGPSACRSRPPRRPP